MREEPDRLAVEEPLEIRLGGRRFTLTMRTPGHDEELAAGFLLAEGFINNRGELGEIRRLRDSKGAPESERDRRYPERAGDRPARALATQFHGVVELRGVRQDQYRVDRAADRAADEHGRDRDGGAVTFAGDDARGAGGICGDWRTACGGAVSS